MGHWLSKKAFKERAMRIIELRDKHKLEFAEIARRMSVSEGVIGYSYHKFKRQEHD